MKWSSKQAVAASLLGSEIVRVLVGPQKREFSLHKKLLCTASSFFRNNLEATPANLFLSSSSSSSPSSSPSLSPSLSDSSSESGSESESESSGTVLWLESESPDVFELFVLWLYQRRAFKSFLNEAIRSVNPRAAVVPFPKLQNEVCRQSLHWKLVRLHLFAALADLPALQDMVMDALQDMYLQCDWDLSPKLIHFLYGRCAPDQAFRLRKWAVAMVAWTLYGSDRGLALTGEFQALFDKYPDLFEDYCMHLNKMEASKANLGIKNPQLRLSANKLRSEERCFGFRQCSFHSHRSVVGEGPCPHAKLSVPLSRSPWMRMKDEADSDDSGPEQTILSSVSEAKRTEVHV